MLDLYERESISLLALMALWGATGAALLASIGNQAVLGLLSSDVETVFGSAVSAPLVEECAKGAALIVAFAVSHWAGQHFGFAELEGPTDGIVYGAAIGLGFAFTEDLVYLVVVAYEQGTRAGFDVFLDRRDFFGPAMLHHAIFTAAFGAGLGLATWSRSRLARIAFPLAGLAVAMSMHAVNNGLVELALVARYGLGTTADWLRGLPVAEAEQIDHTADSVTAVLRLLDFAYIAVFLSAMVLWLLYQRRILVRELAEEAQSGLVGREDVDSTIQLRRRTTRRWQLLRSGQVEEWRRLRRLQEELTYLAFLKWRLRRFGGDWALVRRRRRRIKNLMAPETTSELAAVPASAVAGQADASGESA
jgi:RsiW-degrading membrane proteinase PrsW (M82 family)